MPYTIYCQKCCGCLAIVAVVLLIVVVCWISNRYFRYTIVSNTTVFTNILNTFLKMRYRIPDHYRTRRLTHERNCRRQGGVPGYLYIQYIQTWMMMYIGLWKSSPPSSDIQDRPTSIYAADPPNSISRRKALASYNQFVWRAPWKFGGCLSWSNYNGSIV